MCVQIITNYYLIFNDCTSHIIAGDDCFAVIRF